MSSNESRDVQIRFSIPVIVTGDGSKSVECDAGDGQSQDSKDCGPWKPGAGLDLAKEALSRSGALLDVLQKAQREGQLAPSGVAALESLLRFYAALKAQLDKG
jgi:hypothetical protein